MALVSIKLTPSQAQALCHRLEVSDCISESLGLPYEIVDQLCQELHEQAQDGKIKLPGDEQDETRRLILIDAVEGSTWWPVREEDISYERQAALKLYSLDRSLTALENKLSQALGICVEFPRH